MNGHGCFFICIVDHLFCERVKKKKKRSVPCNLQPSCRVMEDISFIFWVSKVCVHTISLTEAILPLDDCAQMLIIQHHYFHRKLLHKDCHHFLPMRRYTEEIDIHWTSLSFFGLTKHHVESAKKRESPNACWVMVTNFWIWMFLQSWYQLRFDTWLPLRGLLSWLPWKPNL